MCPSRNTQAHTVLRSDSIILQFHKEELIEDSSPLGYDTVSLGEQLPTF